MLATTFHSLLTFIKMAFYQRAWVTCSFFLQKKKKSSLSPSMYHAFEKNPAESLESRSLARSTCQPWLLPLPPLALTNHKHAASFKSSANSSSPLVYPLAGPVLSLDMARPTAVIALLTLWPTRILWVTFSFPPGMYPCLSFTPKLASPSSMARSHSLFISYLHNIYQIYARIYMSPPPDCEAGAWRGWRSDLPTRPSL